MQHSDKIKIIFMDCEMKIMDGFEASSTIRDYCNNNRLNYPSIYGLTGHNKISMEKKC